MSQPARVRYFDRQYLRLADFIDEQSYHLVAHRRHNIGHHKWGIVDGLRLRLDGDGRPFVEPGYGVDGYGRDLVVDQSRPVPPSAFDDLGSDEMAVWLVYDRRGSDPAGEGWAVCGQEGKGPPSRELEHPRLHFTVPDPDSFDPRRPDTVPEGDLTFGPHRVPPDRVADDWWLFLGRLTRQGEEPEREYVVDPAGRPYAELVAAGVAHPADRERSRLVLGGDHGEEAAFAVRVPAAAGSGGGLVTALEVDAAGALAAHGDVTVGGNLAVDGGVVTFGPGEAVVAEGDGEGPAPPRPWSLYRRRRVAEGDSDTDLGDELRLESAEDGAVVVGYFSSDDESFVPLLTIASDHTVTVHGDLVVEGGVISAHGTVVGGLSPEAEGFVLSSFQAGAAGSLGVSSGFSTFGPFSSNAVAASMVAAPAPGGTAAALAAALAADSDLLQDLAGALLNVDSAAAAELADLLGADDGENGGGGGEG